MGVSFGALTRAAIAAAALLAAIAGAPAAEARGTCDPKPPMRTISNDILKNCDIGALNDLIAEYEQIASHHWCRWGLARNAKEEKFDDVTHKLVQSQINSATALAKATKGALKGVAGAKDLAGALRDITSSLDHMNKAGQIARGGFSDKARQDEQFRLYENAEHKIGLAKKILDQLEAKAESDPNCPPKDEKERQAGGSYSGFGITVYVLDATTIRIVSDCGDDDHRIQLRGETGTWATKGVGVSEVVVTDLHPDMTYSVRRRCDHKNSGELTFPLSALQGR